MVYVVPMQNSKNLFSQDSKIHEVQVRKSYFVPFEPIESLENLQMARTDLELGKCVPNSLYVSWSVFYSQIQLWAGRKINCYFLTACSFKERRNLKNSRHTLKA